MSFFFQLVLQGVALGTLYALVGQGLNVTYWTVRVVNFAHGAFLMIAVYLALTAIQSGLPLGVALPIGILAVAVLGVVLERIAIRPVLRHTGGLGWIVATLGAGIVVQAVAAEAYGAQARAFPPVIFAADDYLHLGDLRVSLQLLLVTIVALIVLGAFELVVRRTTWGMVLQAASYDAESARLRGIRVETVITTSFAISGALAGLAGILVAPITGVSPSFGLLLMVNGFAAAVIGGMGSSIGTLVGGIAVGVTELMVGGYISTSAQSAVAFAFLVGVLMVRPTGLFGVREVQKV